MFWERILTCVRCVDSLADVLRWAKLAGRTMTWRWGCPPPPIIRCRLSFSRPASLMTPFPGRHSAFRQQHTLWSGVALLSHSCQTPGPPCPERASNLSDICSQSYLVIRHRPLDRPATDTARSQLSLGPSSFSGDPVQGRDPILRTPREKKPHHRYLLGGGSGWRRRWCASPGSGLIPFCSWKEWELRRKMVRLV